MTFLKTCVLAVVLFLPPHLLAQTGVATLSGTVTDPSGALLPNAHITAINEETGAAVKSMTTRAGRSSGFVPPRVWDHNSRLIRPALCAMLDVEPILTPKFGFRAAIPLPNGSGIELSSIFRWHLLVEAKLTEGGFQRVALRLLSRYSSQRDELHCL